MTDVRMRRQRNESGRGRIDGVQTIRLEVVQSIAQVDRAHGKRRCVHMSGVTRRGPEQMDRATCRSDRFDPQLMRERLPVPVIVDNFSEIKRLLGMNGVHHPCDDRRISRRALKAGKIVTCEAHWRREVHYMLRTAVA